MKMKMLERFLHSFKTLTRPRGYKENFMLSSAEHEILNAHKYKNIKLFSFLGSDKPGMLFFLLIHVKMPTTVGILIVGILICMSRTKFMLS